MVVKIIFFISERGKDVFNFLLQGGSLLSHGDDDAVSWIEEVASTGSTTNALTNSGNTTTTGGTADTPNNTATLSPAEVWNMKFLYNPFLFKLQFKFKR